MSVNLALRPAPKDTPAPPPPSRQRMNPLRRLWHGYIRGQERHQRILLAVQLLYAALFTGWFVYSHTWPAPDVVTVFLLLFAFLAARGVSFLRDWAPFLLLVLAYVALTSITAGLAAHAHVQFPIDADRRMFFGTLPTTALQARFWNPNHVHWYDYAATILYPMHFVVPLVLAFAFWMWKKRLYWRFIAAYLLLTYAGFLTYTLYPMAPPWWAANEGRIPPVHGILDQVHYGGVSNPIVLATDYLRPNPVAAMPSLHAAFPVLVWLVLWRVAPRWGWATILYPLAMSLAVVYLGEHYVVDVLAGWLYAAGAFAITWADYAPVRRMVRGLTHSGVRGEVTALPALSPDR
jgi:membrane-associated phospholipid phosphatase